MTNEDGRPMTALDVTMKREGITVRDWLSRALVELVKQGEGFSGKHPLGMSDWWWDIIDSITDSTLADSPESAERLLLDEIRDLGQAAQFDPHQKDSA